MDINLETAINHMKGLDEQAWQAAKERQQNLLKPIGSLGLMEDISIQMAGITGKVKNQVNKRILFLFGADNGVYEEGIACTPQHFTNELIARYATGKHSAINAICQHYQVDLKLVDIGIIGELDHSIIDDCRLMESTKNFVKEPAMTRETAKKAVEIGINYVRRAKEQGYEIIGTGEVGMGNTTTAAACIMAAVGITDSSGIGRGAGLSDEAFEKKKQVILKGIQLHQPNPDDPLDILSKVGGLDIAALVGVFLGGAMYRLPVVIDGVISVSAALLATKLQPLVKDFLFPSHLSEEPGYQIAANAIGLTPYLNLKMRLGEGAGCPIAMGVIEAALATFNNMSTFADVELHSTYREDKF